MTLFDLSGMLLHNGAVFFNLRLHDFYTISIFFVQKKQKRRVVIRLKFMQNLNAADNYAQVQIYPHCYSKVRMCCCGLPVPGTLHLPVAKSFCLCKSSVTGISMPFVRNPHPIKFCDGNAGSMGILPHLNPRSASLSSMPLSISRLSNSSPRHFLKSGQSCRSLVRVSLWYGSALFHL